MLYRVIRNQELLKKQEASKHLGFTTPLSKVPLLGDILF